jgi:5-methyltetrahydropteroyltriglutamate--homocysteine methyltransferase
MFTGPYTMVDWSFDEYYKDREKAVLDFARQYRLEAEALKSAGCRILQIDEPAASVRLDEWDLFCEGLNIITHNLGIYVICHICYGDFEHVPDFNKVPVDNLDLECANNQFCFIKNRPAFRQDISAGVFDVHTHKQTSKEELVSNIKEVLKVFPPEKVWIDPDCGLRTRTRQEAFDQLKLMVEAVREVRAEIMSNS